MRQFFLILGILLPFVVAAQKKTVAVQLKTEEDFDKSTMEAFRDILQESIHNSKMYKIVARQDDMDMIQQEAVFNMNASDSEIVKWGEAVGADCVAFVNIKKVISNYQISCKLFEANSSQNLLFIGSTRTKQGKEDLEDALDYISKEMFSAKVDYKR